MYKSKLRYLMADKKINKITDLMSATGVSRPPLDKLFKEDRLETLSLEVLAKICDFFQCPLQDLIEYIPNEESSEN